MVLWSVNDYYCGISDSRACSVLNTGRIIKERSKRVEKYNTPRFLRKHPSQEGMAYKARLRQDPLKGMAYKARR